MDETADAVLHELQSNCPERVTLDSPKLMAIAPLQELVLAQRGKNDRQALTHLVVSASCIRDCASQ
eukprot:2459807-Lingulodinium_polyedra.AAC.1